MNTERIFKRIIWLLATIATVPGFIFGWYAGVAQYLVSLPEPTEGSSLAEINQDLAKTQGFDYAAAKKDGASDEDILAHLTTPPRWKTLTSGAFCSLVAFLLVLLTLRGISKVFCMALRSIRKWHRHPIGGSPT